MDAKRQQQHLDVQQAKKNPNFLNSYRTSSIARQQ
jgi:hypothetical protein